MLHCTSQWGTLCGQSKTSRNSPKQLWIGSKTQQRMWGTSSSALLRLGHDSSWDDVSSTCRHEVAPKHRTNGPLLMTGGLTWVFCAKNESCSESLAPQAGKEWFLGFLSQIMKKLIEAGEGRAVRYFGVTSSLKGLGQVLNSCGIPQTSIVIFCQPEIVLSMFFRINLKVVFGQSLSIDFETMTRWKLPCEAFQTRSPSWLEVPSFQEPSRPLTRSQSITTQLKHCCIVFQPGPAWLLWLLWLLWLYQSLLNLWIYLI